MHCQILWVSLSFLTMCTAQTLEKLPEGIGNLTVDCGLHPSEPMTLTYVGEIRAMYASTSPFVCEAESTDEREIVFTMVIEEDDREECGVQDVGAMAFKVRIHVQNHVILVTDDDTEFEVTCNYANVTDGTSNMGVVELLVEEPASSSAIQVPSGSGDTNEATMELIVEDLLTNAINHINLDQEVRLHILDKPKEVCPKYDLQPSPCDSVMAEMTSDLNCTNLHGEPFVDCNSVVPVWEFVEKCETDMHKLTNQIGECSPNWKRDYICALQEMYECICHKEGVHVSWLPSAECETTKSLIFVENCDLISEGKTTPLVVDGCGSESVVPLSWQFSSSSVHSTRSPYFTFRGLGVPDVHMINCTVKLCLDPGNCEQDCSNLPNSVTISYLETTTLSTGSLYLSESRDTEMTTDNSSAVDPPNTGASLDRDIICDGYFNAQNFPLFVAVLVLGIAVLVLLVVVCFLVYQLYERNAPRLVFGERDTMFQPLSPVSEFSGGTLKSTEPTLRAFTRGETSTMNPSEVSTDRGACSLVGGVDRAQNEIAVQICPRVKVPPPPKFNFPPESSSEHTAPKEVPIPVAPPLTTSLL